MMPTLGARVSAACAALLCAAAASAQPRSPLDLDGVRPGGLRIYATDAWGVFDFNLKNRTDEDRSARVLLFFEGRPDEQYGRDVWVPAHATLKSSMLVGPVGVPSPLPTRDFQTLLYDRTGGQDRLLLPPVDFRVGAPAAIYRPPEPATALLAGPDPAPGPPGTLPGPDSPAEEALLLALAFRRAAGLSDQLSRVPLGTLPTTPQAFDGTDHVVLASDRLGHDPAGARALRQWVEQGGRVWVILTMVDPDTVASLLGDGLDFQVVDRVGLTTFAIETTPGAGWAPPPLAEEHDRPVDFVRVLLPPGERAAHTVNGWPAWFVRRLGRGKVLFTALGPRAWFLPARPGDPAAPAGREPLKALVQELQAPREPDAYRAGMAVIQGAGRDPPQPVRDSGAFHADALKPLLNQNVGYTIISRTTVALVFGGFLLAALALGLALRRARRRELVGWVGPAAALGAAAAFAAFGLSARRAAPATMAVVEVVDAAPGVDEAAVEGLAAVYRPDAGPVEAASDRGGFYEIDRSGLQGQATRLVQTDRGAWHWENMDLPAGLRYAPFRWSASTEEPIAALAHFGPDGLEGKFTAGPFRGLADAVLSPPNGRNLSVRLGPDGDFRVGPGDVVAAGQFLTGAVLTDRQQRRQDAYREYRRPPAVGRPDGPPLLMAWAEPIDLPFTPVAGARTVGDALLAVPVRLERAARGKRVTIPGPLLPYRQVIERGLARPTLEGGTAADMHLRFQLPASVLPLRVERARLEAKVSAPGRRVVVSGFAAGVPVELRGVDSPLDPIRIDVTDERLLRLDDDGGLHLNVSLSGAAAGREAPEEKWTIEYLEVEITGAAP